MTSQEETFVEIEHKLEEMFAESPRKEVTKSTTATPVKKQEQQSSPSKETAQPAKPQPKKRVRRRQKVKQKNRFKEQDEETAKLKSKFEKQKTTVEAPAYKGPYIQIRKDGLFSVVNSFLSVDEDDKAGTLKPKKSLYDKTKIKAFHVSTLSNKYDADKADKSWICVYCKKGPHREKLGDLFGPYIVTTNNEEYKFHLMSPSRGGKENVLDYPGMTKISDTDYEVWVHEDCAVWSPGVFIISGHLVGLEDSVWSSVRHRCKYCQENGAMMCCLDRGCKNNMAHYPCARNNKWDLNEPEFKTFCEKHDLTLTNLSVG